MPHYSVATAKDHLSSLIDKALAGEEVVVTRHGKPTIAFTVVATGAKQKRSQAEWMEKLRVLRESLPPSPVPAVGLIRQMRDEGP